MINQARRNLLCLSLLVGGTIICIASMLAIRNVTIGPNAEFGLMSYAPWYFWLGFFSVTTGAILAGFSRDKKYHLIALLLLALVIWFVPGLADVLPRRPDAYWHWSTSAFVINNGHFNLATLPSSASYLQYPAVFLLGVALRYVTGIDPLTILLIFPALITIIWSLGFYLLALMATKSPLKAYLAAIVAIAANVIQFVNHYSPLALSVSLFPLILFLVLHRSRDRRFISITFFLCIIYALSHPIFPLFVSLFALLPLALYFFVKKGEYSRPILMVFPLIVYLSWTMFVGNLAFDNLVSLGREAWTSISTRFAGHQLTQSLVTKFQYSPFAVTAFRWAVLISFIVPASLIGLRGFIKRKADWLTLAFLATLLLVVLLAITSFGTSILPRAGTLAIPLAVLIIFRAKLNKTHVKVFFIISLLMLAPLSLLAYYYGEAAQVTTQSQYSGFMFVAQYTPNHSGILIENSQTMPFFTNFTKQFSLVSEHNTYAIENLESTPIVTLCASALGSITVSEGPTNNTFSQAQQFLQNNTNYNLIYDNPSMQTYTNSLQNK